MICTQTMYIYIYIQISIYTVLKLIFVSTQWLEINQGLLKSCMATILNNTL